MDKRYPCLVLGLFILFILGGCMTTSLRQPSSLSVQIKNKDAQIADLAAALEIERQARQRCQEAVAQRDKKIEQLTIALHKQQGLISHSPRSKDYYFFVIAMQTALRNAGFPLGLIDGKFGERTRNALKNFQKQNGLGEDGKLNKRTWERLRNYQ
ncbi:MAG: peptidoglycan-binding domain-containing protein [Candidatus Omnitrophota bacterium]|jgi:hypothetical protein